MPPILKATPNSLPRFESIPFWLSPVNPNPLVNRLKPRGKLLGFSSAVIVRLTLYFCFVSTKEQRNHLNSSLKLNKWHPDSLWTVFVLLALWSQLGGQLATSAMARAVSWAKRNALLRTSISRFLSFFLFPSLKFSYNFLLVFALVPVWLSRKCRKIEENGNIVR